MGSRGSNQIQFFVFHHSVIISNF